jgi:hypothetical protein
VVKPDPRLIKLLVGGRRFDATPVQRDGVPFAELAARHRHHSPQTSPKPFSKGVSRANSWTGMIVKPRRNQVAPAALFRAAIQGRDPRRLRGIRPRLL